MASRLKPPGAEGPRRRPPAAPPAAAPPPSKAPPSARSFNPASGTVTLEEVLVGFQRSLARATRSSLETARGDWQVGMGQRSLYVVDSIGVTMQAGLLAALDASGQVQTLALDLGSMPAVGASQLSFRVVARPIETIAGEQLLLADTDPLGQLRPRHGMRLTLIGRHDGGQQVASRSVRVAPPPAAPQGGPAAAAAPAPPAEAAEPATAEAQAGVDAAAPTWVPLPGVALTLHITGGDTGATEIFHPRTNLVGQVEITVDAAANSVSFNGEQHAFGTLDLRTRDDDFFVYAACDALSGPDPQRARLTSNVIQFWVQRDSPPAPQRKAAR